ncbi:helix-turn-helix domain-containing protein [Sinorhizobium medicae]|uniref:Helix-turn-helix domain-containing protein n=3 Tax=Sinorhizobium medicae TaxID=110321 RepID=A0A6G1WI98_9HYPH|nr:helix-turn-helix- domain containing protein AraC type [Sinorhizobium medicae WSM419]MDX0403275.1 helix-turn-helix domain-containing protein [Sinorhizobium medicae]MDX0415836.1 helix-turn-helix domain-containing protein [Sinorhizobium medicae]MDX0421817.1 helix-turn-helix domain-containing protein [Sinorhizobium medicae]MDX0427860.1 helix-turn-helix domain-containing protein [Sinorhizobium medicae]
MVVGSCSLYPVTDSCESAARSGRVARQTGNRRPTPMALHQESNAVDSQGPIIRSITSGDISVTRVCSDRYDLKAAPATPCAEAFSVIVQLRDFEAHRLWKAGKLVYEGGHSRASLAITDLRDRWQCHHLSPFDNIRFQIPFARMSAFAKQAGRNEYLGLASVQGRIDPVMYGLAQALLPSLESPETASSLFLEQINLAVLAHLSQTYGGLHFPIGKKGTLAPWQERLATEFLANHFNKPFSLGELARLCELSRSYFNKAFKESFGRTPSRWLSEYRTGRVKELLLQDVPIAEAAIACGFADQSHLTRVFTGLTGETPARYRRKNRCARPAMEQLSG